MTDDGPFMKLTRPGAHDTWVDPARVVAIEPAGDGAQVFLDNGVSFAAADAPLQVLERLHRARRHTWAATPTPPTGPPADPPAGRKPLVYLAAPYSVDPVRCASRAIRDGLDLWCSGEVAVIIPHLTLFADLVQPMSADDWYEFDQDILARCDALLRYPGDSAGADLEVEVAQRLGIPVFHTGRDLLAWVAEKGTLLP